MGLRIRWQCVISNMILLIMFLVILSIYHSVKSLLTLCKSPNLVKLYSSERVINRYTESSVLVVGLRCGILQDALFISQFYLLTITMS